MTNMLLVLVGLRQAVASDNEDNALNHDRAYWKNQARWARRDWPSLYELSPAERLQKVLDYVPSVDVSAASALSQYESLGELFSASSLSLASEFSESFAGFIEALSFLYLAANVEQAKRTVVHRQKRIVVDLIQQLSGYSSEEQVFVISFDSKGRMSFCDLVAHGLPNEVQIDPVALVRQAIARGAASIVIAHNHPSGDTEPSEADLNLTREMAELCNGLKIVFLDHIIVGRGKSLSIANQDPFLFD